MLLNNLLITSRTTNQIDSGQGLLSILLYNIMQNLPPELLEHICIYLPRSTELRSTCRYLSRVINPVNHWYYMLNSKYRLNLVIGGDIDVYNSIFDTNYRTWYDVYLRFRSMDTTSNDVVAYLASKSVRYLRDNIDTNYRLYILRYTNSYTVIRRYIDTLSYSDVLSIFRTNLLKIDTHIRVLSILMQHIVKREQLKSIINTALDVIGNRRYITVYKFIILLLMKYSYNIVPYITYRDLDNILHIVDNYTDYNIDIYINNTYINNVVANIYYTLTLKQVTNIIINHPYIYHYIVHDLESNTLVSRQLHLAYLESKYLSTPKTYTYYSYTSIHEYNLYNNTTFESWRDLQEYINGNRSIDNVIESINRRSPDLVYMLWDKTYNISILISKVIELFRSRYAISYRLVDVLLKILTVHFPFNEVLDIIIDDGYYVLTPEVIELILRHITTPIRSLIDIIPIVIHNNMKRAYESIVDIIKYSKVRSGYSIPIVYTTYLHGGITWLGILGYINRHSMWLSQYNIERILRELKNRDEIDITDEEIEHFEYINVNIFSFRSNRLLY